MGERREELLKESYETYSKNYEKQMEYLRLENWYDIFPFSLVLWPQTYSENIRRGKWWRNRYNYTLLCLELLQEGELSYEQNGETHLLKPGDLYISHVGNNIFIKSTKRKFARQVQLVLSGSILKILMDSLDLNNTFVIHFDDSSQLLRRMSHIGDLMTAKAESTEVQASASAYEFLAWLAAQKNLSDVSPILTRAIRTMHCEMKHAVSIAQIAQISNTSPATLNRLFRKYLNTSPQVYINKLRMENAKNLIAKSPISFKELAEQLGFQNALYFSTAFKKYTGMSPSEYRKNIRIANSK